MIIAPDTVLNSSYLSMLEILPQVNIEIKGYGVVTGLKLPHRRGGRGYRVITNDPDFRTYVEGFNLNNKPSGITFSVEEINNRFTIIEIEDVL